MSSGNPFGGRGGVTAISARSLQRLPIFPLPDVTLFPDTVLPLHIFEPRYRKMTTDVLAGNRLLGIAQRLEMERPEGPPPRFATIFGVGQIVASEPLPDGRYNLVVQGRARVRLVEELETDEPYRLVRATVVPDEPARSPDALAEAESSLRALVEGLCQVLPDGGSLLRQVVASQTSAAVLANVLAAAVVVEPDARQRLLETTNVLTRVERLTRDVAELTSRFTGDHGVN